jgi:hypothetical protein
MRHVTVVGDKGDFANGSFAIGDPCVPTPMGKTPKSSQR